MKETLLILVRVKSSMAESVSSINNTGYLRYYSALNLTPTGGREGGGGGVFTNGSLIVFGVISQYQSNVNFLQCRFNNSNY